MTLAGTAPQISLPRRRLKRQPAMAAPLPLRRRRRYPLPHQLRAQYLKEKQSAYYSLLLTEQCEQSETDI